MSANDLFVELPTFTKVAGYQMPPNKELWSEAVFEVFSEQYPELASLSSGDVGWDHSKSEFDKNFAIGTIVVNANGKVISVPIIINDAMLEPIDIFSYSGKMYPLVSEYIKPLLVQNDDVGTVGVPRLARFSSQFVRSWMPKEAMERIGRNINYLKKITRPYKPYLDDQFRDIDSLVTKIASAPKRDSASVLLMEKLSTSTLSVTGFRNGAIVSTEMIKYNIDNPLFDDENFKKATTLAFDSGSSVYQTGDIIPSDIGILGVNVGKGMQPMSEPSVYSSIIINPDGSVDDVLVGALNVIPFSENMEIPKDEKILKTWKKVYITRYNDKVLYSNQQSAFGVKSSGPLGLDDRVFLIDQLEKGDVGVGFLEDSNGKINFCTGLFRVERIEYSFKNNVRRIFISQGGNRICYITSYAVNKKILPLSEVDSYRSPYANMSLVGPNLAVVKIDGMCDLIKSPGSYLAAYDASVIKKAEVLLKNRPVEEPGPEPNRDMDVRVKYTKNLGNNKTISMESRITGNDDEVPFKTLGQINEFRGMTKTAETYMENSDSLATNDVGPNKWIDITLKSNNANEEIEVTTHIYDRENKATDSARKFVARMMSLGIGEDKIAALINYLKEETMPISLIGVVNQDYKPVLDRDLIKEAVHSVNLAKEDFVKAAVWLNVNNYPDIAGTLIKIALMDEENVRYFIKLIPAFEDTLNSLAKLLYSVRVGVTNIDEGAVKSSLMNLSNIILDLRRLQVEG